MDNENLFCQIAAKCSTTEMCIHDVKKRLDKHDLDTAQRDAIIARLLQEKYIDESRYARAFTHDKFHFSGWGRLKIRQALCMKHLSSTDISQALSTLSDDECLLALRSLIATKRRSVHGRSAYEINGKLARFALGRGFEYDLIQQCLSLQEEG